MASSRGDEYSGAGYLVSWAELSGEGSASVLADVYDRNLEAFLNDPLRNISAASLSVSDGSAALPSYTFSSDPNTGMYSGAADEIFFSTGGTENLRLTGNNIRMASSASLIYNVGAFKGASGSAAAPTFTFDSDTNTGMYRDAADSLSFSTGGTQRLDIDSGGIKGKLAFQAPYGSASAPSHSFDGDTNIGMYRYSSNRIGFGIAGTWRAIVDSGGILVNGSVESGYGSSGAPTHTFNGDNNTGMYRHASDKIGFSTAGSFRAYISSTYFYLYPRILQDSSNSDAIILQSNTNTVGSLSKWVQINNNSGTRQGFTGMYNGNMYLWADVGAALIQAGGASCSYMNGSSVYIYDAYNNASTGGSYVRINSSGLLHRYSSSRVYKTDFEPLADEFADLVLDIEPVFFRSTASNDNPNYSWYGAVAEDVALIDPRFAEWGPPDGGCDCPDAQERGATWDMHEADCFVPTSINYGTYTMHLINIAKRQRDTIASMEIRLQLLEKNLT